MKGVRFRNGRWRFSYYYQGERRERSAPLNDENSAAKERSFCLEKVRRLEDPDVATGRKASPRQALPTFAALLDEYLAWLKPEQTGGWEQLKANRSYHNAEGYANRLKAYFTGSVGDVTSVSLRAYAKSRGVSAGTTNREVVGFLRAAYKWWDRSYPERPLPNIIWRDAAQKHQEVARDVRVTNEDIAKIVEHLNAEFQPLPHFAVATMMRSFEIRSLEWKDVRATHIELPKEKTKGRRGQRRARKIPLTVRAQLILKSLPGERHGLVFRAPHGGFLWGLNRAMAKATRAAGLPDVDFHSFRHEGASRYVEAGGDLRSLMEIGGWSSLKLVERYTHASLERERDVMERADKTRTALSETETVRQA